MDRGFPYPDAVDTEEPSKSALALAANLNRLMKAPSALDSNPKLSERSGLPTSTISRLRNAKVEATLQVVQRLADAFSVAPSRLLDDEPAAWPFTLELHAAVTKLPPETLVALENVMRAALSMDTLQKALQPVGQARDASDPTQMTTPENAQSATDGQHEQRYSGPSGKVASNGLSSVKLAQKWAGKSVFDEPAKKKDGAKDGSRSTNRKAPRK
jgi:hypothetical protein